MNNKDVLVSAELAKEKLIHEIDILGNVYAVAKVIIMELIRNTDLTDCQPPMTVAQGTPNWRDALARLREDYPISTLVAQRIARIMEAEVAALSAPLAELNKVVIESLIRETEWKNRAESLAAQVVELQKDADRYRWLRDKAGGTLAIVNRLPAVFDSNDLPLYGINLDTEIDAANPVHSTVTRASVPPSVKDSGT